MLITWSDWQQRLELVEPEPRRGLTPEQSAEVDRAMRRMVDRIDEDITRCMLGLPPIVR